MGLRRRAHPTLRSAAMLVAAIVVLAGVTAGCTGAASGSGVSGRIGVVASTSVWGSIATVVGGRHVDVASIIYAADQDPHSFEASARTLLQVKEADLLIENGGGYDDFMAAMISSAESSAPVLDAVALSGYASSSSQPVNEHVWYDVRTVEKVAMAMADELGRIAPRYAADFATNARRLVRQLGRLVSAQHQTRALYAGTAVAITEPVPLYMLAAMGLRNQTPEAFSEAVEEGFDVSARTLSATLDLYSQHQVAALVYNEQTAGPITEEVKAAAASAGIPVIAVTETLPEGMTYLQWMSANVAAIAQALNHR